MKYKKLAKVLLYLICVTILAGTVSAAFYSHRFYWKSVAGLGLVPDEALWRAVQWRAQLYLKKAKGGVPELSWTELWELTRHGKGFFWTGGRSLEASFGFSTVASESDRAAGESLFRAQCTGCHGMEGSGGTFAPPLRGAGYKHGDSDLAIYKVVRDGVPGTAMPSHALPPQQLLQLIAYIRKLQVQSPKGLEAPVSRLAVKVSSERLLAAGSNPDEWLMYSGSYNGWRRSSLTEINPANVAQLKIRWIKQFDINASIIEATPLVAGGAIFMAASVSHVVALDAKTGVTIWDYERPVPADLPLCCEQVNRGLAVYGSTIFFSSLDGYLVALNANDGKVIWETLVGSPSDGYTMTGAPLVVGHSVVVGVAGGDVGCRCFLAAYDVSTGQQQWKFETIPGPGEAGHETWGGGDAWRTGGGSTWNTGSYDPSAGLIYWGVGNASPVFSGDRRPGDNLFTDSVIAVHADSGKLAWYFQFTPHDEHNWDSTQTPVLTDLSIGGIVRKVICWPNRNGFYYVLDRVTGEFLAGVPFVELDWAKGLTPAGRPILADSAEVTTAGRLTKPGLAGGTSWQNPAFDPQRGSIFVPATEGSAVFTKAANNEAIAQVAENETAPHQRGFAMGSGVNEVTQPPPRLVRALDAATGRRKWEYLSSPGAVDQSGLLGTAAGLVFGAAGGFFFALDADSGRELWRVALGGGTYAAPISFALDGRQVIAMAAGRALFVFGL